MAWNKDKEITMEYDPNFDFIIEEGQNTSINLRKVSWNGRPAKLDLRKWSYQDGNERAMKGVGLSDEGAHELTGVLVENGYGDTRRLIKAIQARDDYDGSFKGTVAEDTVASDDGSEEYYDPSELFGVEYE